MEWVKNVFVFSLGMISAGHRPLLRCHFAICECVRQSFKKRAIAAVFFFGDLAITSREGLEFHEALHELKVVGGVPLVFEELILDFGDLPGALVHIS